MAPDDYFHNLNKLKMLTTGVSWQPEYGPELESIDQEPAKMRKVIDTEHTRRKEIAH